MTHPSRISSSTLTATGPWTKSCRTKIEKSCATKKLDVDVDSTLLMVMGAFLEGESKMLADTAEVNKPKNLEMHKSGLQLWRLSKYNFDRASAFSVTSNLESILNMQEANSGQDVMSTLNLFERRHQVYDRQTVTSNESEFVKMETLNISVHPEVSQTAHWVKVIPDSIVKELKKNTNINFEKDSYSETRDVVTPIWHNHMNAATPMDVSTKNHEQREREVTRRKRRV